MMRSTTVIQQALDMIDTVQMTVRKIGNSVGFTLPALMVQRLRFEVGQVVEARAEEGQLIVALPKRRSYTRAELLAQCDPKAPIPQDMRIWEQLQPVGNEVI
jgi:antitoxin ChpS